MNHDDATKSLAAERYILGELNQSERDDFEEHFFDCVLCAEEVRETAKFAAGVRTAGARHHAALSRGRMNWWAAASVILAAGLGYQTVLLHLARARESEHQSARVIQGQMLAGESRGSGVSAITARPGEPLHIYVPFVAPGPGSYRGEFRDAHGRQIGDTFSVPAPADEPLSLFVPAGTFHPGSYSLVIRGAGGQEISTYQFEVRSP